MDRKLLNILFNAPDVGEVKFEGLNCEFVVLIRPCDSCSYLLECTTETTNGGEHTANNKRRSIRRAYSRLVHAAWFWVQAEIGPLLIFCTAFASGELTPIY